MKIHLFAGCIAALCSNTISFAADAALKSPDALKGEIESLRVANVAWREISWNACLLDGLSQSRQQNKPVLLWIFIDRPADDARC